MNDTERKRTTKECPITAPILVSVDDAEYLLKRRRHLVKLSMSLNTGIVLVPANLSNESIAKSSKLVSFLRADGIQVVLADGPGKKDERTHCLSAIIDKLEPRLVVIAASKTAVHSFGNAEFSAVLQRRSQVPLLFLDVEPDQETFDQVVAACDTRESSSVAPASADMAELMGCDLTMVEVLDSQRLAESNHARREGMERMQAAVESSEEELQDRAEDQEDDFEISKPDVVVRVGDIVRELNSVAQEFESPLVVIRGRPGQHNWNVRALLSLGASVLAIPA